MPRVLSFMHGAPLRACSWMLLYYFASKHTHRHWEGVCFKNFLEFLAALSTNLWHLMEIRGSKQSSYDWRKGKKRSKGLVRVFSTVVRWLCDSVGVLSARYVFGSCSVTWTLATKRLSRAQLNVLDKSVPKDVAECIDVRHSCTTGGGRGALEMNGQCCSR